MASILCIEDEPDLRHEIVEELEDAGYRVIEAANGVEGLDAARKNKPDLILCDISMPKMNGREMLTALRDEQPELAEVPFLFLSALASREDQLEGMELGADDYLTKPLDFEILRAKIMISLRQVSRMREMKEREQVTLYKALTARGPASPMALPSPRKILLVGREDDGLPKMRASLQAAGHEVQTINSGNHYLGEVAAIKTDLTLLWFYSDDMRADIVAKMAAGMEIPSPGRRILVWPEAMAAMPEISDDMSVDDILFLPCDIAELLEMIENWTAGKSGRSQGGGTISARSDPNRFDAGAPGIPTARGPSAS